MRKLFLLVAVLVATSAADETEDDSSSSAEITHEKQRRSMLQALNDNSNSDSSLFTSPQEQRSQYYIHEGLKSALQRSLRLSNFDADLLWDYLEDNMNVIAEEEEEEGGVEMAYPQFLEEVLTGMIKEVEESLQKLATTKDEHHDDATTIAAGGETEDGNINHQKINDETNSNVDLETAFYDAFSKARDDRQCDNYNNVTLNDPRGKWDNITKAYWKFFNMDPPTKLLPFSEDDDDYYNGAFFSTEGNVYFDFLRTGNKQTTQQRGMFAARDFEKDELVYSFMANGLFFLELSTFETFVRNSTLLPEDDACLLAQWSFAQKLTRPGRYYICSSVDEGAFFNQATWRTRANVYIEDNRDLKYYASQRIVKGEEILYSEKRNNDA